MNLDGYVDVATRLRLALEQWPELRIQETAHQITQVGDQLHLVVEVTVWRTPDDPKPTVAQAWEPWPGRTPYQRYSEHQVGATSALGRALGYMGLGLDRGIASADEVASRVEQPAPAPAPNLKPKPSRPAQGEATQAQLNKVMVLLTELAIIDREAKVAKVAAIIGRPITSSKDLTRAEASTVIDTLEEEAALSRAMEAFRDSHLVEEPTDE